MRLRHSSTSRSSSARPSTEIVPVVGVYIPVRSLTRVVLPARVVAEQRHDRTGRELDRQAANRLARSPRVGEVDILESDALVEL